MRERIGRYQVRGVLGEGATGTVFHCWDDDLARAVAVKVLHDSAGTGEALERFRREARILASLSHPNIVGVFDVGSDGPTAYIAMEYVGCPSLRQTIAEHIAFPLDTKLQVAARLCSALGTAHARGVTHRDVKPANIMVDVDGSAKLVDFGIARLRDSTMTKPSDWLGTPAYASPESLSGLDMDGRADLYSLAVSLYEWIAGRRPHVDAATPALIARILNEDAPDIRTIWPECPAAIALLLRRALARNRDERFQSAEELEAALLGARALTARAVLDDPGAETRSLERPAAPRRSLTRRRNRGLVALAAVAVLAFGVRAGVKFARGEDAPRQAVPSRSRDVHLAAIPVAPQLPAAPPAQSRFRTESSPGAKLEAPTDVANRTSEPSSEEPDARTIPVGTRIVVSIITELRTDRTSAGSEFLAQLAEPLSGDGIPVAPAGARVRGIVDAVFQGTRDRPPALELQLTQVAGVNGPVAVRTARYRVTGPEAGSGQNRWLALAIGGAAGAVVGGAVGGGKAAAAGGAIGAAAAGAAAGRETGERIYSLGNTLTFKLAEELRLIARHEEERDDDD